MQARHLLRHFENTFYIKMILNFTGETFSNPLEVAYKPNPGSIIFEVPLQRCRYMGTLAFPLASDISPFAKALKHYAEGGHDQYKGSWLEHYYNCCVPNSAAEGIGIPNHELNGTGPLGVVWLWKAASPEKCVEIRQKIIENANHEHGCDASYMEGSSLWGKVSMRKGSLELKRLIMAYENIKKQGFKIDYTGRNNVEVIFLYAENDWVYIVISGNHRMAALSALGYETVPVQLCTKYGLGGVLKFEDARYWPAVINGILSESEAKKVFKRMFRGEQPAVAANWQHSEWK
jgi:hypothetical protein